MNFPVMWTATIGKYAPLCASHLADELMPRFLIDGKASENNELARIVDVDFSRIVKIKNPHIQSPPLSLAKPTPSRHFRFTWVPEPDEGDAAGRSSFFRR